MDFVIGVLGALVAIAGWGLGDFFGARLSRHTSALGTYFVLTLILAVLTAPFAISELDISKLTFSAIWPVVGIALSELIAGYLFYAAMRKGKTSIVEPVSALSIAFTVAFAFFLLDEKITILTGSLLGVSLIGGVLVSLQKQDIYIKDLVAPGALLALFSATVYGGSDYVTKLAVDNLGPVVSLFLGTLLSAFISLILLIAWKKENPFKVFTKESLFAGVIEGFAWVGYVFALDNMNLTFAAGMINAYPVVTMFAARFWDKEELTSLQKLGAAFLILASIGLGLVVGISK